MRDRTSFRIGGPADLLAFPRTVEEARELAALAARESFPCFILGGGTNILVSDRGIRGLVIDLGGLRGIESSSTLITALCGTPISDVSEFAMQRGLSGLQFAYSLPGSVGGAVWMNARCYERQVSDALAFVESMTPNGETRRRIADTRGWGYKTSPFQGNGEVILRAGFALGKGDPARIREEMEDHKKDRETKGHFLFPCAGSIFKNNRDFGMPTGRIVDSLGLKGLRIGGAQIAPFHGNIIINTGDAKAAEVLALIERVEGEVRIRLGFQLEREVILVGDWGQSP